MWKYILMEIMTVVLTYGEFFDREKSIKIFRVGCEIGKFLGLRWKILIGSIKILIEFCIKGPSKLWIDRIFYVHISVQKVLARCVIGVYFDGNYEESVKILTKFRENFKIGLQINYDLELNILKFLVFMQIKFCLAL